MSKELAPPPTCPSATCQAAYTVLGLSLGLLPPQSSGEAGLHQGQCNVLPHSLL